MVERRDFIKGVVAGGILVAGSRGLAPELALSEPAESRTTTLTKWVARDFTPEGLGNWPSDVDQHIALYKGYVSKANELLDLINSASRLPEKQSITYSELRELKVEYSFAIGGIKNHEVFFGHQSAAAKKNAAPSGELLKAIEGAFDSFEGWRADIKATGISARGWAWLALDLDKQTLFNYIGDAQNSYPIWSAVPILALDMYEHAFFKDYGRNRAAYIDAFFERIDWTVVERNYRAALKKANA